MNPVEKIPLNSAIARGPYRRVELLRNPYCQPEMLKSYDLIEEVINIV